MAVVKVCEQHEDLKCMSARKDQISERELMELCQNKVCKDVLNYCYMIVLRRSLSDVN